MNLDTETTLPSVAHPGLLSDRFLDRTDLEYWNNLKRHRSKSYIPDKPETTESQREYSHKLTLHGGLYIMHEVGAVSMEDQATPNVFRGVLPWRAKTAYKDYEPTDSATLQQERPENIHKVIDSLFKAAKEEHFEDGIESEFSTELISLIEKYDSDAVDVIGEFIISERVNPVVASEALCWLGRIEHHATYGQRLRLLERCLNISSVWIRDGAALGLAALDDPSAIPYLELAIHREEHSGLRKDMEQVLDQLENTRSVLDLPKE